MGLNVGVFGPLSSEDYGDRILPLILEHELRRRLPSVSIAFHAEPPGEWTARHPELDAALDLSVLTHPDIRVLVADLFALDVLERRLRQLRAVGAYPSHGRPLVVEADRSTMAQIDELRRAASALDFVFLSTAAGNDELAYAMGQTAGGKSYVVGSHAMAEDVAAAIAHARAVVGTSPGCAATAISFGIPWGTTLAEAWNAGEDRDQRERVLAEAAAHLDRLAGMAEKSAAARIALDDTDRHRRDIASLTARNAALRNAHQALREKLAAERALFAEAVNRFGEGDRSVASLLNENAWLLQQNADAKSGRTIAEQRADAAERAIENLEGRLETAVGDNVGLCEELSEVRRRLAAASADLTSAAEELARTVAELHVAQAENQRHRLVLRTRIVSAALRVQQWVVRLKRR